MYADLVVGGAAEDGCLGVARDRWSVQQRGQELEASDEYFVRAGHVQHTLQAKCYEHIYSAGHGAYRDEFPIVRDSQLGQGLRIRDEFVDLAELYVPELQETMGQQRVRQGKEELLWTTGRRIGDGGTIAAALEHGFGTGRGTPGELFDLRAVRHVPDNELAILGHGGHLLAL